jgi:hypothetical protein
VLLTDDKCVEKTESLIVVGEQNEESARSLPYTGSLGFNPRSVLSFSQCQRFCAHSSSVFPVANGECETLGSRSVHNATHSSGWTSFI